MDVAYRANSGNNRFPSHRRTRHPFATPGRNTINGATHTPTPHKAHGGSFYKLGHTTQGSHQGPHRRSRTRVHKRRPTTTRWGPTPLLKAIAPHQRQYQQYPIVSTTGPIANEAPNTRAVSSGLATSKDYSIFSPISPNEPLKPNHSVSRYQPYQPSSPAFVDNGVVANSFLNIDSVASRSQTNKRIPPGLPQTNVPITKGKKFLPPTSFDNLLQRALEDALNSIKQANAGYEPLVNKENANKTKKVSVDSLSAADGAEASEAKQAKKAKAAEENESRVAYDPSQPQYSSIYDPDPFRNDNEYSPLFAGWDD